VEPHEVLSADAKNKRVIGGWINPFPAVFYLRNQREDFSDGVRNPIQHFLPRVAPNKMENTEKADNVKKKRESYQPSETGMLA
jgi:hypothetical protein